MGCCRLSDEMKLPTTQRFRTIFSSLPLHAVHAMSYSGSQQDVNMDSNGDITMSEAGPSKRAGEMDSISNHDSSKPPVFVLPPDPSEAKAKNAKFSYVTAESRLPPRKPEEFLPSKKTGVVYDAQMMLHAPMNYNPELDWEEMSDADDDKYYLAWHPEDPRRIQKIYDQLQEQGLTKQMLQLPCPTVSVSDILLVHSEALFNKVEKTQCKLQRIKHDHIKCSCLQLLSRRRNPRGNPKAN